MPPPAEQLNSLPCWHIPNFVLKIEDLDHEGASIFLENVRPREALKIAVEASYTWLYTPLTAPRQYVHVHSHLISLEKGSHALLCPSVKTITLVLRPFDGVAHTLGSDTDKEIHFSLDYISGSASRARDEIIGVLVHEVAHCYQQNALDTCPDGLIEGIAGVTASTNIDKNGTAH